jgi:pimeloyl-ACP methyl ester carboxylesterase
VIKRVGIGVVIALYASGCVQRLPQGTPPLLQLTRGVTLNGFPVTLHLVRPVVTALGRPLLIYATGDGGWRGKDLDLFRHLATFGYATAGFSAADYIKHLRGDQETTTPALLARDYAAIIEAAKNELTLPSTTPVILVGVSRGAGLSVVAAGQPEIQQLVNGVVVMALTKEEEHVRWRRRRQSTELEIYDYLPRLAELPVAVIQSTRDNYLPADQARSLFGADTDRRQFHAIDARNHSFAGARPLLYETLRSSLEWVVRIATPRSTEKAR